MSKYGDWDWKRAVPIDVFYQLSVTGFPGWDKGPGKDTVPSLHFRTKKGEQASSRELAIAFDDIAEGEFYYRDWTDSGLPFVEDGEIYQSRFYFAVFADLVHFENLLADSWGRS